MKYLLPNRINFAYVDEEMLQVYVAAPEKKLTKVKGKKWSQLEDVYEDPMKKLQKGSQDEVLFFEYLDGDLQAEANGMYVSWVGINVDWLIGE